MESALVVFNPGQRDLPVRIEGDGARLGQQIEVHRDSAPETPFSGRCQLPAGTDLASARVFLELDGLTPEEAARVTKHLKPGANTVAIEPGYHKLFLDRYQTQVEYSAPGSRCRVPSNTGLCPRWPKS